MKLRQQWILLILTLPGKNAALRMRLWRNLKTLGAADLRDGVYALPAGVPIRSLRLVNDLRKSLGSQGGQSYLFKVTTTAETTQNMRALFDRSEDYAELTKQILAQRKKRTAKPDEAWREVRELRRRFDAIAAVDFFPGETAASCRELLTSLEAEEARRQSADEPSAASPAGSLPRLKRSDYQNRVWVTRERLWIDRLASAWLIRRFIDPKARFLWLKDVTKKPANSLGFDYDGAEFTHTEKTVTFETLAQSFLPDAEPALHALGRLIHFLDAGGHFVPGADGVEMVLRGIRSESDDDDAVLEKTMVVFDGLLMGYRKSKGGNKSE